MRERLKKVFSHALEPRARAVGERSILISFFRFWI